MNMRTFPSVSDTIWLPGMPEQELMDLQLSGLWGAIVAFLITLIVQKLLIPVSSRFNLLDHPAGRKDHAEPTPVTGGVAMLAGLVLASVLTLPAIHSPLGGFLGAATLLVVVGLLDDKYDLDWRLRILAQILAALIMIYFGGIRVHYLGHLFGHENLVLGSLSVPFTVFATVGIINAVNMIDGADGLAGLLVLAALVMLSAATVYSGNQALLTHLLLAIGAVCGFLLFNLRHRWQQSAKSFMGNSGSALLGLMMAWMTFRLTQTPSHPVTPLLALWLIPIPIIDCLVLMARRIKLGQSPFRADHNHIHHLMIDAGFTPTGIALTLAAFSCASGLLVALALRAHWSHNLLLGAFFLMTAIWYWLTGRRARALAFFGASKVNERESQLIGKEVPQEPGR